MPNIVETTLDIGSVALADAVYGDELVTVGGATTLLAGTILARDSSTGKLIAFVKGGVTNEDGIPKAVLTYEVVAGAAGDIPVRACVAGQLKADRLVIAADGDGSNIDAAVKDQLRAYGIVPVAVTQQAVV